MPLNVTCNFSKIPSALGVMGVGKQYEVAMRLETQTGGVVCVGSDLCRTISYKTVSRRTPSTL